jgi:hypothetical protein
MEKKILDCLKALSKLEAPASCQDCDKQNLLLSAPLQQGSGGLGGMAFFTKNFQSRNKALFLLTTFVRF